MKKTVIFLLILFMAKEVYAISFVERCQLHFSNITHFLRTTGQKAKTHILRKGLETNLTPEMKKAIASAIKEIELQHGKEAEWDVRMLQQLLTQKNPSQFEIALAVSKTVDAVHSWGEVIVEVHIRKAIIRILQELLKQKLSPEVQREIAFATNRTGEELLSNETLIRQDVIHILQQLLEQNPSLPETRTEMASAIYIIVEPLGEGEAAIRIREAGIRILQQLAEYKSPLDVQWEELPSNNIKKFENMQWVIVVAVKAAVQHLGEGEAAIRIREAGIRVLQQLSKQNPSPKVQTFITSVIEKLTQQSEKGEN